MTLCPCCGDRIGPGDACVNVSRPVVDGVPWRWVFVQPGQEVTIATTSENVRFETRIAHLSCARGIAV